MAECRNGWNWAAHRPAVGPTRLDVLLYRHLTVTSATSASLARQNDFRFAKQLASERRTTTGKH